MKRKIIKIDADKCNGCGNCIPNCPEGAIQMIDGKARLISDLFCDGLGVCLGTCPVGAIEVEEREAEPYNEEKVMENIIKAGHNTIKAHLKHLKDHGEDEYFERAVAVLNSKNITVPALEDAGPLPCGCPGTKVMDFSKKESEQSCPEGEQSSQLRQWPVQLHLVPPKASYFVGKDLVLAADCVAYSLGNFHRDYLKGKSLAIACPKLDEGQDIYLNKLVAMIDEAKINTLTVMTMEVPCCGGLVRLAKNALAQARRKIPIKSIVVGVSGAILSEEWF
ncbi:4Fe-4S ferredoxin [candidate division WOR-1 bacterium RIFOXYB2_FULL_42_35]|uniref:4Fe-4S ferredoxin n=1 Tax=candidate division WOR-1 bacterium RIFOXYC2_FULL_41_25 TaxID=1802586 RepID=A0A1F4TJ37_UNCSA|nr:MAG: 4Fe-4S ferredoxin [candidate division WOR-1 bacterium RIFOXYA2_FULL_41_14]OGC21874.1 MAG: 4Fe-4S ferredoxin [candidate division WOR-1 bacterium RIFOXYB2_FULL_42_35]OGC32738.1 MAG: 4Fe-4S ferredoxin [candidate division WOR-1 bacterium RIFOXYC2_FULL_41_25]OGC42534.1 MAG: 4Fe-4S ferredoxin [candidate division WOR-1 bacterium RIFOXYD2_FULL_41_8]